MRSLLKVLIALSLITLSASSEAIDLDDCLGPFDGFPECGTKVQWYLDNKEPSWFADNNLDRSRCSMQQYLSTPSES